MTTTHAHSQAGYCHLRAGNYPEARHHLRQALRTQGSTPTREGALRYILLATTYLRQPQPDRERALGGVTFVDAEQVDRQDLVGVFGQHRRDPDASQAVRGGDRVGRRDADSVSRPRTRRSISSRIGRTAATSCCGTSDQPDA